MIPFNKPCLVGNESEYIRQACESGHLCGDGPFTKKCQKWLENNTGCQRALLTHSCTAALEMAAILVDIQPGDEVIMPSYTFVSTANAFVLRGGVPVFVDIRPDTLNIDETKIEEAITSRTKAIVPVHYAGVGCEMDVIMSIADRYGLYVIEDAAQGIMAKYKGRPLGSIGHLGCYSFHETKNIICGEGGALLINDTRFVERAEIIREKGTNRSKFLKGLVDKYTWVDIGSSYLPSELNAAFLFAQLEKAQEITDKRLEIWGCYHQFFEKMERKGELRRPIIPKECKHNAHMYYLLMSHEEERDLFIQKMRIKGLNSVFHYVPLHSSVYGRKTCRVSGDLINTNEIWKVLARLPLCVDLLQDIEFVDSVLSCILS
jgi:dTDP-4-amino-4,6-dideoxygalactose transaminase